MILPNVVDTRGQEVSRSFVQPELMLAFGGYSTSAIKGAWKDPATNKVYRDESTLYTIAMEDTLVNRENLRTIARQACGRADQITVYVRMPDGEVEFVDRGF
jgi:hypothetical protein